MPDPESSCPSERNDSLRRRNCGPVRILHARLLLKSHFKNHRFSSRKTANGKPRIIPFPTLFQALPAVSEQFRRNGPQLSCKCQDRQRPEEAGLFERDRRNRFLEPRFFLSHFTGSGSRNTISSLNSRRSRVPASIKASMTPCPPVPGIRICFSENEIFPLAFSERNDMI